MKKPPPITLKRVCVHNLQAINLTLPSQKLIVCTGVSGSGKSSLAFDTLYVEGQRRYVESLSPFARKQIGELSRPDVDIAEGITPTIAIQQASSGRNPRSTVGTMTEIYDYLRLLYARGAVAYCPVSREPVMPQSKESIIEKLLQVPEGMKLMLLAPCIKDHKGSCKEELDGLLRKGFTKARVDGVFSSLDEELNLDETAAHTIEVVIDRFSWALSNKTRLLEGVEQALEMGKGLFTVVELNNDGSTLQELFFSLHAYSAKSGLSYPPLEPHDFSFNSPSGMCPHCQGLGIVNAFDLDKVMSPDLSIAQDCCSVASPYSTVRYGNIYNNLASIYGFSVNTPWKKLSAQAQRIFLYGTDKRYEKMRFVHPTTGATWIEFVHWSGVLHEAMQRYTAATSARYRAQIEPLLLLQACPHCLGSRLKPYPSAALLSGLSIQEVTSMTIEEAYSFFEGLPLTETQKALVGEVRLEICARLEFLKKVGLNYLTLDRTAPTLSGGESQRVRLASQIGCGLVGMTYILDEPSIGLHPRDNHALIETLRLLCNKGNTVVVVEHDEETVQHADWVVDFGPGAGKEGGEILYSGPLEGLQEVKNSLTADYLTGRKELPLPKKRRKRDVKRQLVLEGARLNNLKNVRLELPLGLFVTVTGVSGSGKSSLIFDTLYLELQRLLHNSLEKVGPFDLLLGADLIDKVIAIDQSPIGRTPRSNPATYIKLFDNIRALFSELPESKARGYGPGRFSFNVQEGSCPECRGMGMIQMDMDFMEDSWVVCPLCQGLRFDQETLSIRYKGKNIDDVLKMTVSQAHEFFGALPMRHKLETLEKVGLGYLTLGQSCTTLSGGEAQRIKLSRELTRPSTGKTLYILDEPTTGLHFHDVAHLLKLLQALVDRGNSVVVIEHHIDVMRASDWIIDLGPSGGKEGGQILFGGTPEKLAKENTPTGIALKHTFDTTPQTRFAEALRKNKAEKAIVAPFSDLPIQVIGAEQNCLKDLSVTIPRHQITFCVGRSGAGKSTLAFETLYAEAQRRYLESLSPYARQFVKQLPKPKVQEIRGLSPAIAIEQKAHAGNPRSTVGTLTEIYDYLRILYSRLGVAHCPETGEVIRAIHKEHVAERILALPESEIVTLLAPIVLRKQDVFAEVLARFYKMGFTRVRLAGTFYLLEDSEKIPFDRKKKQSLSLVIDRIKVGPQVRSRLIEGLEQADKIGSGQLSFLHGEKEVFCNLRFSVESTGRAYPPITPHTFSFNTPSGMCIECQGLGVQYGMDLNSSQQFLHLTPATFLQFFCKSSFNKATTALFRSLLLLEGIPLDLKLEYFTPEQKKRFLFGGTEYYTTDQGTQVRWIGVNTLFAELAKVAHNPLKLFLTALLQEYPCSSCGGSRLSPLARHVTVKGKTLGTLCDEPIDTVEAFIQSIVIPKEEGKTLLEAHTQLVTRLRFLKEVGLNYLSLHRTAPSLSGGEFQRIRLARQLGAGLTGVLYILDEPSTGLHPSDQERLMHTLKGLRDLHNTLLIVEQDPLLLKSADYFIELGPKAGREGGRLIAAGEPKEFYANPDSITAPYLTGQKRLISPHKRRKIKEKMVLKNAALHTLKDIKVLIPLNVFCCVTGVSGSGKSTLVHEMLLPAVEQAILKGGSVQYKGATLSGAEELTRVIAVDQNPVGQTSRSDVITYVEALSPLREFFAALPQARTLGLEPKHFSYNHRKGMCTTCMGMGYRRVEMYFLPPLEVPCPACHGMRLNPLSLKVQYQQKNLGQWLELSVEEAATRLKDHPKLTRIFSTLISIGLGYLSLGQEVSTLSGGEAQRLKLSAELAKRSRGPTLYLLDEPAAGLHSEDLPQLLEVLHKLVEKGHSLIVIDHRLDLIQSADYIIELGPGAGDAGGNLVAEGTPEELSKCAHSPTGKHLRAFFEEKVIQKKKPDMKKGDYSVTKKGNA